MKTLKTLRENNLLSPIIFISILVIVGVILIVYAEMHPRDFKVNEEDVILTPADMREELPFGTEGTIEYTESTSSTYKLPSTRDLVTQCEAYGYAKDALLKPLLSIFGEGTMHLDAYIAGEQDDKLTYADDFYTVTIYKMSDISYSMICEVDSERYLYVQPNKLYEVSTIDADAIADTFDLTLDKVVMILGTLQSKYPDMSYDYSADTKSMQVYTSTLNVIATLYCVDNGFVVLTDNDKEIYSYVEDKPVDEKSINFTISTEAEDANIDAIIKESFPWAVYNIEDLTIDNIVDAYNTVEKPLNDYDDSTPDDAYMLKDILNAQTSATHWYVDYEGNFCFIYGNRSSADNVVSERYAKYSAGHVIY